MALNHKYIKHPGRTLSIVFLISILITACTVQYKFSGANISINVKTISIAPFQNRASLVQPGLTNKITDALIDKCKAQTKLSFINGTGDVSFEGEITDYNSRPLTVGADSRAAMNRFTITVKVKFVNSIEPDNSFENKVFSRYKDYDSNLDLSSVEASLTDDIVSQLVEDIFNEAFTKW